jgi:hypothetical protein
VAEAIRLRHPVLFFVVTVPRDLIEDLNDDRGAGG